MQSQLSAAHLAREAHGQGISLAVPLQRGTQGVLRLVGESRDPNKKRGHGTYLYQPGDYDLIDLYEGRYPALTVVGSREAAA